MRYQVILEVALVYEGLWALGTLEMPSFLMCSPMFRQLHLEGESGIALVAAKVRAPFVDA